MSKRIVPAICTSTRCNCIGGNYCTSCSHAIFEFHPKVNGKVYKAWFKPYFGVSFNHGGLKNDPNWSPVTEKHPLWKAIDTWFKRFGAQSKRDDKAFNVELQKDKKEKGKSK